MPKTIDDVRIQNRILFKDRFPIRNTGPGGARACFSIFGPQRLMGADLPTAARKQGKPTVNAQAGAELGNGAAGPDHGSEWQ